MSKPRFNWWSFALNMIRDYPARRAEYRARYERGDARPLPMQEQKEFIAVHKAIESTKAMEDGRLRIRLVDITLWKKTNTIAGAAMLLNISEETAKRYRWQFVLLVGHTYGFLSDEEYQELAARRKESKNGPARA